ncbi:unnamed protein product [marine sediment metagenome]|uniref:Uncharacterized protein n=1 Tax=marine sediment metagenome TaxID=412755 RepID=X0ZKS0_9ZZZZ
MIPREEINKIKEKNIRTFEDMNLIIELLLDIRDLLLEKTKPKGKTREEWEKQF